MLKLCMIFVLCSFVLTAMPVVHGNSINKGPKALRNWYKTLPQMKQKVTELHFYLHDIVSGSNPTNIPIAMPNSSAHGLLAAMDDILTARPSPNSEIVGRARGLFGSTSMAHVAYHMTFDFVFTSGKYNGSTISVIGHNPFMQEFRELPIVGGSGVFRLARGSALLDSTSGDAVVEYNVVVVHY